MWIVQLLKTPNAGSKSANAEYSNSSTVWLDYWNFHAGVSWRVDVAWDPRKGEGGETLTLVHAVVSWRVDVAWGPCKRKKEEKREP